MAIQGIAGLLPDRVRENLTAKLLLVLLLAGITSASIGLVAFLTISDDLTAQVDEQTQSLTAQHANIYASWLAGKWNTLQEIKQSDIVLEGEQSVRGGSLQNFRSKTEDFRHFYVANLDSGEIVTSTNDRAEGANIYDLASIDRSAFDGEMYLSPEPVVVREGTAPATVFALRTFGPEPRILVGTVPASAEADIRQVYTGSTTSIRSVGGARLFGDQRQAEAPTPASVTGSPTVTDTARAFYGFERITHETSTGEVSVLLVTRIPKSEAFVLKRRVTRDLGLTFVLTVVVLIGASLVTTRVTTRRITDLADRATAVSNGAYDTEVESDREDEIGTLYTAVREMRDSLAARIRESRLVEHSYDLITVVDTDGTITYQSPSARHIVGFDPEEIEGGNLLEMIHDEDSDAVASALERVTDDPDTVESLEFRARNADGEWRHFEAVCENFLDDPFVEGLVLSSRDFTERKEYERELEDTNQKLELLNRIVRHDIRNDMTIVLGNAEIVREAIDDEADRESLDRLIERGEHVVELTEILRDLMETMLDESDTTKPVALGPALDREMDTARSMEKPVDVDGPDPYEVTVHADEMLGTVFRNLLTNAVRHNDTDRPELSVSVTVDGTDVLVRIADNGPGVPDDQKDEIFGRGEKGLESSGSGVGLFLVDTLVEGYGGDVWVEDSDAGGAAFVVRLRNADHRDGSEMTDGR